MEGVFLVLSALEHFARNVYCYGRMCYYGDRSFSYENTFVSLEDNLFCFDRLILFCDQYFQFWSCKCILQKIFRVMASVFLFGWLCSCFEEVSFGSEWWV